jgi:multicomponent Na+:H+ antiporter subunit A
MLAAVLVGFVLALLAPWLERHGGGRAGWLLAVPPLGLTGYFLSQVPRIASGDIPRTTVSWVPSLGLNLAL